MTDQNVWLVHPGEVLTEKLEEIGMTRTEFAIRMGCSLKHVSNICRGRSGYSAAFAMDMGDVLRTSGQFWINLLENWRIARKQLQGG